MSVAKALGNGVPIGACLARGKAAGLFQPGHHGSTFGGNLLACRAALTVIDVIEQQNLMARSQELGDYLLKGFAEKLANVEGIVDIRGKGLMMAIELDRPCAELVSTCLAAGVLINVTAGSVIRLLPPYVMTNQQADEIIDKIGNSVLAFLENAEATVA